MTAPPEPGWAVEDRLAALWQVDPDPEVATHARTATLAAFTGPSTRRRRLRVPVAVAGCVLVSGGHRCVDRRRRIVCASR
ncbi:MAG TPA: hypothetical protein VFR74_09155 [Jiangellales bacterium]|nr:hypothetical protein [Jiangellales bacterium]